MSESDEEPESQVNKEVFHKFLDFYTPSEEDVQRQFTTDELKKLCRRLPCRVEMSRWNMVNDYSRRFQRENRLQNKTPYQIDRLLEKAINRHKANDYTQAEKDLAYKEEWLQRKRDNFLRLRLWHHDSKTKIPGQPAEDVASDELPIATPSSPTVLQADVAMGPIESAQLFEAYMNVNTESMSIATQSLESSQSQPPLRLQLQSQPSEPLRYDVFDKSMPLTSTPNFDIELEFSI